MKQKIISKLTCPICNNSSLEIHKIINQDNTEIREGTVKCSKCNSNFNIHKGIIDFLINPGDKILNEQKGWAILKNAVNNTDELMLSLPEGLAGHKDTWRGQSENFYPMVSKLKLK